MPLAEVICIHCQGEPFGDPCSKLLACREARDRCGFKPDYLKDLAEQFGSSLDNLREALTFDDPDPSQLPDDPEPDDDPDPEPPLPMVG